MSGKDALLRAGSGSWSSAKALLPVLLRGILSDFSLIMASSHRRRAPLRRHRGIALHADIDGGSAVSSATDRGSLSAAALSTAARRSGARHFGPAYSQRLLSHRRLARAGGGSAARGWQADEHAVHTCAPISSQLFIKGRSWCACKIQQREPRRRRLYSIRRATPQLLNPRL